MNIDLKKVKEFGNIELLARQLVEGFITGMHKSPYHGFSVEFAEHRLYNTGESTKYIDWKAYAKTDRLYSKRFEEETNLRCHLVIDNSSSMYYPVENKGKVTFSILSAAALAYLLQKQRDAVGIFSFSDKIELQTQIKSTSSHLHKLFISLEKMLDETPKTKKTSVAPVLHEIAEKIHKRSLVIIFSDMFQNTINNQEIFTALQHLKHNKHEVLLFHVTDILTELNFNFEERPYEFQDMESGEKLKLQPSQIKDLYQQKMKEYYQALRLKCGQFKIDYVEADINKNFDQVLSAFLIKRTKMT
ncbi:DUF58 domain-containing protein [Fulvivirgaceae bacterium BMA12]|uniref:DUF58 domain-containing protein n=1 Tax=Agaribacillus aureus TaxID=3051825 RepID=A0ABT8L8T1_9BACT|nr:DUF58 domain-containing protein [Fulvivirgaceae bacterium BMA12]